MEKNFTLLDKNGTFMLETKLRGENIIDGEIYYTTMFNGIVIELKSDTNKLIGYVKEI